MGLLLAFTFTGAATRFDRRRDLIIEGGIRTGQRDPGISRVAKDREQAYEGLYKTTAPIGYLAENRLN
jgi:hypothetical protein